MNQVTIVVEILVSQDGQLLRTVLRIEHFHELVIYMV